MKILPGMIGRGLCGLLLVFLLVPSSAVTAAEAELDASRQRLGQIQQQIDETLKGLRGKKTESGVLAEALERLEVETRRIERLTKSSNQQLSDLSDRLKKQRQSLKKIEGQKHETEQQIRHRLVVLYKTGEVGLIKALLSETESPRDIAEKYAFLSRMVRHDRELLVVYRQQVEDHQVAVSELEALRKQQSSVVSRRRKEEKTLQKARKSKKVLLAEVKKDTKLLNAMLRELRAKAARLNELVKTLETEQTQPYTENLKGLLPQKGRLFWPVPGKLKVGFGTSRHGDLGTLIESHGFDIQATVDTPVQAAAQGKVIFANSLRGYGKLMIVDHGSKYYTLYAHVARFTKQIGDFVAAAEVIAYSGYEGRDAVYFEIRQRGKPIDPADWLKPR
ncbi:MAG: peptidoglycan DD-metalloendopeptidase family protein [Desulfuromonadales bacterium]|nr:peptidoglycan DD-metalloendopeptidase family protein [Desulfuromonadales bacterium]